MSAERTFAWRTWAAYGGHLLDARFDTPEDAGRWRRERFPGEDDGVPLTLVALIDGRRMTPLPSELAASHWAWLADNEEAAGGPESRTAA